MYRGGKGSIQRYFNGSLVHENLRSGDSCFEKYGYNIIKVTKETFTKCSNRFPEAVMEMNMVHDPAWIVLVPFCAMSPVNYRGNLPQDEALEGEKQLEERRNNDEFIRSSLRLDLRPLHHISNYLLGGGGTQNIGRSYFYIMLKSTSPASIMKNEHYEYLQVSERIPLLFIAKCFFCFSRTANYLSLWKASHFM